MTTEKEEIKQEEAQDEAVVPSIIVEFVDVLYSSHDGVVGRYKDPEEFAAAFDSYTSPAEEGEEPIRHHMWSQQTTEVSCSHCGVLGDANNMEEIKELSAKCGSLDTCPGNQQQSDDDQKQDGDESKEEKKEEEKPAAKKTRTRRSKKTEKEDGADDDGAEGKKDSA